MLDALFQSDFWCGCGRRCPRPRIVPLLCSTTWAVAMAWHGHVTLRCQHQISWRFTDGRALPWPLFRVLRKACGISMCVCNRDAAVSPARLARGLIGAHNERPHGDSKVPPYSVKARLGCIAINVRTEYSSTLLRKRSPRRRWSGRVGRCHMCMCEFRSRARPHEAALRIPDCSTGSTKKRKVRRIDAYLLCVLVAGHNVWARVALEVHTRIRPTSFPKLVRWPSTL